MSEPSTRDDQVRLYTWADEEESAGNIFKAACMRAISKRLATAEKERDELDKALLIANLKCNEYGVRMDRAEATLATMTEALRKYGDHLASCATGYSNEPCDCGFAILAPTTQSKEGGIAAMWLLDPLIDAVAAERTTNRKEA